MTSNGVEIQTTRNCTGTVQFNAESGLLEPRSIGCQLDARTTGAVEQHALRQVELCQIIRSCHGNLPRCSEGLSFARMKERKIVERCIWNRLTRFGLFRWHQNVQFSHLLSDIGTCKDAFERNSCLCKGLNTPSSRSRMLMTAMTSQDVASRMRSTAWMDDPRSW